MIRPKGLTRLKTEREREIARPRTAFEDLSLATLAALLGRAERALRLPVAGAVAAAATREFALAAEARALAGAVLRVTTTGDLWAHRRQSRLR